MDSSHIITICATLTTLVVTLSDCIMGIIRHRQEFLFHKHELYVKQKLEYYNEFTSAYAALYASNPGDLAAIGRFQSAVYAVELIAPPKIAGEVRSFLTTIESQQYISTDLVTSIYKNCVSMMRKDYHITLNRLSLKPKPLLKGIFHK